MQHWQFSLIPAQGRDGPVVCGEENLQIVPFPSS